MDQGIATTRVPPGPRAPNSADARPTKSILKKSPVAEKARIQSAGSRSQPGTSAMDDLKLLCNLDPSSDNEVESGRVSLPGLTVPGAFDSRLDALSTPDPPFCTTTTITTITTTTATANMAATATFYALSSITATPTAFCARLAGAVAAYVVQAEARLVGYLEHAWEHRVVRPLALARARMPPAEEVWAGFGELAEAAAQLLGLSAVLAVAAVVSVLAWAVGPLRSCGRLFQRWW